MVSGNYSYGGWGASSGFVGTGPNGKQVNGGTYGPNGGWGCGPSSDITPSDLAEGVGVGPYGGYGANCSQTVEPDRIMDLMSKQSTYNVGTLYDKNGYDKNGYDKNGYDKNGYDKYGYNKEGYNKEGYDKFGYDKNGYNKYGYNNRGYDKYGFNPNGVNKDGKTRNQVADAFKADFAAGKYTASTARVYLQSIGAKNIRCKCISSLTNKKHTISFTINGHQYSASWSEKTKLGKVLGFIGSLFM